MMIMVSSLIHELERALEDQDLTYMFPRSKIALLARLRRFGGMRGFANRSINLS